MSRADPPPLKKLTIALAGNPNSGKTTVFNAITGARQHVGNYPGVTVERKEGRRRFGEYDLTVVDLPGTYSLTAQSIDELVARNFIVEERPDVVVAVIDATNLERNLYLATQLMELGVPLVLAFNMSDIAESLGHRFDYDRLSKLLGAPIVPTVGHRGKGIDELLEAAVRAAGATDTAGRPEVRYGRDIDKEVDRLADLVGRPALGAYPRRWLAVKLLENDPAAREKVGRAGERGAEILAAGEAAILRLRRLYDDEPEVVIAEGRYGFISGACEQTVRSTVESRHAVSDRIDKLLTNGIVGIPIFLVLTWLVFQLTFTLGEPPSQWIEAAFGWLGRQLTALLPEGYLRSALVDGVIRGVGGVIVFLPNILLLFLGIAFLEDSGYMARRAAFIMDSLMRKIGLQGRSFIPLLLGFGCTIPAVMATRTLRSRRDRFVTILVSPFMSCAARLPIYVLLTGAFFSPKIAGNVIFSVYLLGIAVAVVMAKVFRRYLLRGARTPFVMELPPYRLPTLTGVLVHMWERGWLYLKKAGTVILAISLVIWALSAFPRRAELKREYAARVRAAADAETAAQLRREVAQIRLRASYAGRIGRGIAPLFEPLGLNDWRIGTALFAGFGAKELVVSTLGTLYGLGETDEQSELLRRALRQDLTPLKAYAMMVFVLLYVPCMASVAVVKRETNSWRWPLFIIAYTTVLAWVGGTIVYQGGCLLGLG